MSPTTATGRPPQGQRERILDVTLDLMAEKGASATSMRALATACGLNVAALYHYFPSKDALLRAVIEERRYGAQIQALPVPDMRLAPAERLAALVIDMWDGALAESTIWKLLLSEALHGDGTAREVGSDLLRMLEAGMVETLPRVFPELVVEVEVAARMIASTLVALLVEASLLEPSAVHAHAERRAHDLGVVLLPAATEQSG